MLSYYNFEYDQLDNVDRGIKLVALKDIASEIKEEKDLIDKNERLLNHKKKDAIKKNIDPNKIKNNKKNLATKLSGKKSEKKIKKSTTSKLSRSIKKEKRQSNKSYIKETISASKSLKTLKYDSKENFSSNHSIKNSENQKILQITELSKKVKMNKGSIDRFLNMTEKISSKKASEAKFEKNSLKDEINVSSFEIVPELLKECKLIFEESQKRTKNMRKKLKKDIF